MNVCPMTVNAHFCKILSNVVKDARLYVSEQGDDDVSPNWNHNWEGLIVKNFDDFNPVNYNYYSF